jgi:alpha-N-arabinofuranosidase
LSVVAWISLALLASPPLFSQTLPASISVDAKKVVRQIPSALYGSNVEWAYNGWNSWDSVLNQPNVKFADLVTNLRPTVLRFPGGTLSDFYHWQNGTGAQNQRPASSLYGGSELSPNGFGSDEVLSLAKRVGGSVLMTVNVATGTPEEAAAWVRYVNRGSTVVRDWEIGNELYLSSSPSQAQIAMTPATYAQKLVAFATAMRAADPNIRIGAIGGDPIGIDPNWNKTVLQVAGNQIDFLAVHNAYAPIMTQDRGESLETVYRAMLAAPSVISTSLKRIATDINTYAPLAARSRISIYVTEWGPLFHIYPQSRFIDHPKTLASALFMASMMKVFIETPTVAAAMQFKLVDNSYMGLINVRNGAFQETAPYDALSLFTQHFGTQLLASTTIAASDSTPAAGIIPAVQDSPYVQTIASLSADGSKLYMICINRHFTSPFRAKIQLANFPHSANALVRTLSGTNIDANTGTQLPFPNQIPWAVQASASTNPRFPYGGPTEILMNTSSVYVGLSDITYDLPAFSITAFEIALQR